MNESMYNRHKKYNIFDENGTLVFRYNTNIFPPSDHSLGIRTYPVLKIAVVTQGEADWRFRNTLYHVRQGDIVLLRPKQLRNIEKVYEGSSMICDMYEFLPLFLKYNMNCMRSFYTDSEEMKDVIPCTSPESERLLELFSRIQLEMLHPTDLSDEVIRGYMIVALATMDRHMSAINGSGGRNPVTVLHTNSDPVYDNMGVSTKKTEYVFDMVCVTNYIGEHFIEEIDVELLARSVHMSRSQFYKIFRQYNGISVNQYILQCRIKHTVQLLLTENVNILEAAYRSGFTSSSGFYNAFHQVMGVTPKEYLKFMKGTMT